MIIMMMMMTILLVWAHVMKLPTTEGKMMKWKLILIQHKDIAAPHD
jgi:hypothetical protein